MTRRRAFTLIEVLVVVAIIGLLVAIAVPSISEARRVSKRTYCAHNLHQIGVGMQSYLQTNHDRFPVLCEYWTLEQELPEADRRPPISRGLARELGNKSKVFECPADVVTEITPGDPTLRLGGRYFDVEETSYDWRVQFNGLNRRARTVEWESFQVPFNSIAILTDFEAFHGRKEAPRSRNYLYPDLRVESEKGTGR